MSQTSLLTDDKKNDHDQTMALTVVELNRLIEDTLETVFPQTLTVSGELSNLKKASSGHYYFSLKDNQSTIACALFKNNLYQLGHKLNQLQNGDQVIIKAKLSVYKPRGSYMLIVNDLSIHGEGDISKAFLILKEKLDKAGLTASKHKKKIPAFPNKIALVTSSEGAAIQDVIITLKKRAPFIPVVIYPTLVQGDKAPNKIIKALKLADNETQAETDAILIIRGGGSLEDLAAFNDESLAMAIVACKTPVISGVGHETDITICDLVADYRAATPTAAAEAASPDKEELLRAMQIKKNQLKQLIQYHIKTRNTHLRELIHRLSMQHPQKGLQTKQLRMDEISFRLDNCMTQKLQSERRKQQTLASRLSSKSYQDYIERQRALIRQQMHQLNTRLLFSVKEKKTQQQQLRKHFATSIHSLLLAQQNSLKNQATRLALLNPAAVLEKGYAIIYDVNNKAMTSTKSLKKAIQQKESIQIRLKDGRVAFSGMTLKNEE